MLEWLQRDQESLFLLQMAKSSPLLTKLRKALIEVFTIHHRKSAGATTSHVLSVALSLVSMSQGLSLVLRAKDSMTGYEDFSGFFVLVNATRVESVAVAMGWENLFFYVMLAAIYAPVAITAGNIALVAVFKRPAVSFSVSLVTTSLSVLEQVLFVPFLVLMTSSIKYGLVYPSAATMHEYGELPNTLNSAPLAVISLFTLPVMVAVLFLNSYFFYENVFSKRKTQIYAMSSSYVHRVHLLGRFLMVLCYSVLSEVREDWYRLGILALCTMLFHLYQARATYYNLSLNVQNASKKAIIAWSVVAYYAGWWADAAGVIVALMVFVSPVIVALVYMDANRRLAQWSVTPICNITTSHHLGLKLRSLLYSLETCSKDARPQLHQHVEELFSYGTLRFRKSPLLVLWEANYYFYSRGDPFLATLKLSKMQVAESTLESDFFVARSLRKFTSREDSQFRAYLRYLKLMEKAKKLDESFCLELSAVCQELLSRKPSAQKCEQLVACISRDLRRTTDKYFRILELYPDNLPVLRLLGSLLSDVMKEEEGEHYLARARIRRNSDKSPMGAFMAEVSGLIVLSLRQDELGVVSLANSRAEKILKVSNSGELANRDFRAFLPRETAAAVRPVLTKLTLFDFSLSEISQLLKVLVDADGTIISVNVSYQITTWNNLPFLILTMEESPTVECRVLVDAAWRIVNHSGLDLLGQDQQVYQYMHIHALLPRFLTQLSQAGEYRREGGEVYRYKCESFTISGLTLVTLAGRNEEFSQPVASLDSIPRAKSDSDKKEVKFGVHGDSTRTQDRKTSAVFTEPHENALLSDSEAKLKKKYNITSSIQSSALGAKTADSHERLLVAKYSRRLKWLLFLSFLITVAGVLGSMSFITQLLSSLASIDTIRTYSRRNELVMLLAYDARSLTLCDYPQFQYLYSDVADNIISNINELNAIIETMKKRVTSEPGVVQSIELGLTIPTWENIGGRLALQMTSLVEALMRLTLAGKRLSSSEGPYSKSPEGFYIVRNAAAEVLEKLNETTTEIARSEQDGRTRSMQAISILVIICFVLLVVPIATLVAPQLWVFERLQQRLWARLYSLPREAVIDQRSVVFDRLQTVFSNEMPSEPMAKDRLAEPRATRIWLRVALRLSVYFACSGALLLTVEVAFVTPLADLALTIPNYIFWSAMRPQLIAQGLFWSREALLRQSELSYSQFISEGSYWPLPEDRVQNATGSMSFITHVLNFGAPQYGVRNTKKSNGYLNYLSNNACIGIERCEDTASAYGAFYELKNWKTELTAALKDSYDPATVQQLLTARETLSQLASLTLDSALNYYSSDAEEELKMFKREIVALCVAYSAGVMLLYFLLYAPTVTAIEKLTLQGLQLHRVLATRER